MTEKTEIDSSGTRGFAFDPLLDAQVTINHLTHLLHQQKHFVASDYDDSVVNATPKYWLMKIGVKEAHIKVELNGSNAGFLEIFETPTTTDNGTPVPTINNFRSSLEIATTTVFSDPTVSVDGTRILVSSAGNDSQATRINSLVESQREFILTPSKDYLFKYNPLANQRVSLELMFYELIA